MIPYLWWNFYIESFIIDVWQGPKHAFDHNPINRNASVFVKEST